MRGREKDSEGETEERQEEKVGDVLSVGNERRTGEEISPIKAGERTEKDHCRRWRWRRDGSAAGMEERRGARSARRKWY